MQAKLETITYKGNEISKWSAVDGFCCYDVNHVASAINLNQTRKTMRNYTNDELVNPNQRLKYGIITYKKYKDTTRKDNKMILLTEKGLKRFLCNSRTIESIELAKFLGIDIYSYKAPVKEANYIGAIMRSFPGEEFILQYTPDGLTYRIDAYMPEYNIAIECDENHHALNTKQDLARQANITEELGCRWVRFQPDNPDFDIFETIGAIHLFIKGN